MEDLSQMDGQPTVYVRPRKRNPDTGSLVTIRDDESVASPVADVDIVADANVVADAIADRPRPRKKRPHIVVQGSPERQQKQNNWVPVVMGVTLFVCSIAVYHLRDYLHVQ